MHFGNLMNLTSLIRISFSQMAISEHFNRTHNEQYFSAKGLIAVPAIASTQELPMQ